jgi:hypothetical protein
MAVPQPAGENLRGIQEIKPRSASVLPRFAGVKVIFKRLFVTPVIAPSSPLPN